MRLQTMPKMCHPRTTRAALGAIPVGRTVQREETSLFAHRDPASRPAHTANSHWHTWIHITHTHSIIYEHFLANPSILNIHTNENFSNHDPLGKLPPSNVLCIEARW